MASEGIAHIQQGTPGQGICWTGDDLQHTRQEPPASGEDAALNMDGELRRAPSCKGRQVYLGQLLWLAIISHTNRTSRRTLSCESRRVYLGQFLRLAIPHTAGLLQILCGLCVQLLPQQDHPELKAVLRQSHCRPQQVHTAGSAASQYDTASSVPKQRRRRAQGAPSGIGACMHSAQCDLLPLRQALMQPDVSSRVAEWTLQRCMARTRHVLRP